MAKESVLAGTTSHSVNVFIRDSASTGGAGLAGLAFNTANLIAYYTFTGANAAATQIVLATLAAVGSAYSSGGFKEIDATLMKGLYRLDLPNAVLAAAKGQTVTVILSGASGMVPCVLEIELTAVNNQSASAFITGVNSLAPPTNWNLLSIDGSGRTTVGTIVNGAIAAATFAANALDAVWATAARTITGGTIGTYTGNTPQTGDAYGALAGAQAEPVSVPAANASPLAKLGYVFTKSRNKSTQTATTQIVRNDADSATIATIAISDDTITFVKGVDT